MMNKVFIQLTVIFSICFAATSCIFPNSDQWKSNPDKNSVFHTGARSGKVVDAQTGKPIEGAVVVMAWSVKKGIGDTYEKKIAADEVLTDKKGEYHISSQTIKTKPDWFPRLQTESVLVFKPGYIAYKVRQGQYQETFPYLSQKSQFYNMIYNTAELQPWQAELSHAEHIVDIEHFVRGELAQVGLSGFPVLSQMTALESTTSNGGQRNFIMMEYSKIDDVFREKEIKEKRGEITRQEYIQFLVRSIGDENTYAASRAHLALLSLNETSGVPVLIRMCQRHLYHDSFKSYFRYLCIQVGRMDYDYEIVHMNVKQRQKALSEIEAWYLNNKDKSRLKWFCDLVVDKNICKEPNRTHKVRDHAAEVLGDMGDKSAVSYLVQCLEDGKYSVEIPALHAIEKIGDKSAIPYIKKMLKHSRIRARYWAAITLRHFDDTSGIPVMFKDLQSWQWGNREIAEGALQELLPDVYHEMTPQEDSVKAKKIRIKKWRKWWKNNKYRYQQ